MSCIRILRMGCNDADAVRSACPDEHNHKREGLMVEQRFFAYDMRIFHQALGIDGPGLFAGLDCCSDEDVACEAVGNYCEQATMKSMQ